MCVCGAMAKKMHLFNEMNEPLANNYGLTYQSTYKNNVTGAPLFRARECRPERRGRWLLWAPTGCCLQQQLGILII